MKTSLGKLCMRCRVIMWVNVKEQQSPPSHEHCLSAIEQSGLQVCY